MRRCGSLDAHVHMCPLEPSPAHSQRSPKQRDPTPANRAFSHDNLLEASDYRDGGDREDLFKEGLAPLGKSRCDVSPLCCESLSQPLQTMQTSTLGLHTGDNRPHTARHQHKRRTRGGVGQRGGRGTTPPTPTPRLQPLSREALRMQHQRSASSVTTESSTSSRSRSESLV